MYFRIDTATEEPLQLNEDFSLHVLGERGAQIGQGKLMKLVGRHLIATVAEPLAAGTCVSIPCREGSLLAETLGCWREGRTNFISLEVVHAVRQPNPVSTQIPRPLPGYPSARTAA